MSHHDIDLSLMTPVFEEYGAQKGALIPILQKAQGIYGYLPPQVLKLIADRLRIPLSKVYGVATFYSQFYLERRGRHVLQMCDGTACHVKGTPSLIDAVRREFHVEPGGTTEDGELTVEVVYCLGSCALAPVAVLDGQVMGRVRKDRFIRTIKKRIAAS
ncbi:MAG TPA: NAD(P)H-dependent oxidoreductase subunit E [Thermoflexia bacterium]|jgi:NADH-quinone oxidoreductase subunit E|nr:NAD(P)H-dependent oxidoreductase subunit E [Thermoflexia bacterium]